MRTINFLRIVGFILLSPLTCFSQIQLSNNIITIDLDITTDSIKIPVTKGKYTLDIISKHKVIEKLFVDKKLIKYPPLQDSMAFKNESLIFGNNKSQIDLLFYENTEYLISIKLKDETITRKYILQSKSDFSWKTSFGMNAIFLNKRTKYVNRSALVQEITDNNQYDIIPSIMFTFMNFQRNLSWGFTAGLGTDFKKISVFTGASFGIGQNIIITGGLALHEQVRPDSDFNVGQKIEPSLADDKLNKDYYRFNPFVGITFNLNNNPFKKRNSN